VIGDKNRKKQIEITFSNNLFIFYFAKKITIWPLSVSTLQLMGRNNPENIKKHNDKLHKAQAKAKKAAAERKERLKEIMNKFKESNPE